MSRWHALNGRRWGRVRLRVLDAHGWRCAVCGKVGREVDHLIPLHHGGAPWDEGNLQVLCRACHIRKSRLESGRGVGPSAAESTRRWGVLVDALRDSE